MPENFANRYQTTLAAAVTSGALTGTVVTATGAPAVPFRAIISAEGANTDEIVLVTGRTGTTLTWTRAAEAVAGVQAASAHASGATLTAIVTAAGLYGTGGVFRPEAYGSIDLTGATDNSTAIQACITASAGKGAVLLSDGIYRADSQLVHPGGYVHITGGAGAALTIQPSQVPEPFDGPVLDLRYSGAGAKFVCLKVGVIEIDHITITDYGTSSTPFLLTTLTVPKLHDALYAGNAAKIGATCDQDAIVLGGTDQPQVADVATSAFAGYGGYVRGNFFHRIRRMVYGRNLVDGIVIADNTNTWYCGSNVQPCAPIEIDPGGSGALQFANGNVIRDNTLELLTGYTHGVRLVNQCVDNLVSGNGYWDPGHGGGSYITDVFVDEANLARNNQIFDTGYSDNHWLPSGMVRSAALNFVWSARRQPLVVALRQYVMGARGLLHFYRLGETSGTVAADLTGRANGTYSGSPTFAYGPLVVGDPNRGISLHGVASGDGMQASITITPAFTVAFWVQWAQAGNMIGAGAWKFTNAAFVLLKADGNAYGTVNYPYPLDSAIHFFCGRYDGTTMRLQMDGSAAAPITSFSGVWNSASPGALSIGQYVAPWIGVVQDLMVYNRALSDAEVKDIYAIGTGA